MGQTKTMQLPGESGGKLFRLDANFVVVCGGAQKAARWLTTASARPSELISFLSLLAASSPAPAAAAFRRHLPASIGSLFSLVKVNAQCTRRPARVNTSPEAQKSSGLSAGRPRAAVKKSAIFMGSPE